MQIQECFPSPDPHLLLIWNSNSSSRVHRHSGKLPTTSQTHSKKAKHKFMLETHNTRSSYLWMLVSLVAGQEVL